MATSLSRILGLALILTVTTPALAQEKICLADDAKSHGQTQKKERKHAPEVRHSIIVRAKPQQVWEAIQHERKADVKRKLISYDGGVATLHETFASLPILGEASCVYEEHEAVPFERMEYHLVKSENFSVFQGTWILSPNKDGQTTTVELSNEIDAGIRVPFWQDITKMAASKSVKRRLDAVSSYAEQLNRSERQPNPLVSAR